MLKSIFKVFEDEIEAKRTGYIQSTHIFNREEYPPLIRIDYKPGWHKYIFSPAEGELSTESVWIQTNPEQIKKDLEYFIFYFSDPIHN